MDAPLGCEWTLYVEGGGSKKPRNLSQDAFEEKVTKLGSFNSIVGFWQYWNSLPHPSTLPSGSNVRLFRAGISPTWEDPRNAAGGKLSVTLVKEKTMEPWRNVVLEVIGENLTNSLSVTGIVLSIRDRDNFIHVWSDDSRNHKQTATLTAEILNVVGDCIQSTFKPHNKGGRGGGGTPAASPHPSSPANGGNSNSNQLTFGGSNPPNIQRRNSRTRPRRRSSLGVCSEDASGQASPYTCPSPMCGSSSIGGESSPRPVILLDSPSPSLLPLPTFAAAGGAIPPLAPSTSAQQQQQHRMYAQRPPAVNTATPSAVAAASNLNLTIAYGGGPATSDSPATAGTTPADFSSLPASAASTPRGGLEGVEGEEGSTPIRKNIRPRGCRGSGLTKTVKAGVANALADEAVFKLLKCAKPARDFTATSVMLAQMLGVDLEEPIHSRAPTPPGTDVDSGSDSEVVPLVVANPSTVPAAATVAVDCGKQIARRRLSSGPEDDLSFRTATTVAAFGSSTSLTTHTATTAETDLSDLSEGDEEDVAAPCSRRSRLLMEDEGEEEVAAATAAPAANKLTCIIPPTIVSPAASAAASVSTSPTSAAAALSAIVSPPASPSGKKASSRISSVLRDIKEKMSRGSSRSPAVASSPSSAACTPTFASSSSAAAAALATPRSSAEEMADARSRSSSIAEEEEVAMVVVVPATAASSSSSVVAEDDETAAASASVAEEEEPAAATSAAVEEQEEQAVADKENAEKAAAGEADDEGEDGEYTDDDDEEEDEEEELDEHNNPSGTRKEYDPTDLKHGKRRRGWRSAVTAVAGAGATTLMVWGAFVLHEVGVGHVQV